MEKQQIVVEGSKVIWQSDKAKKYWCPQCRMWISTQYEGSDDARLIRCDGPLRNHVIEIG